MDPHPPRQKELHSSHQDHKLQEKICAICGDISFQEAIITCYRCKNVDVHEYCELGYLEEEPKNWCCQECDKGKGVMSSLPRQENDYSEGSKLQASAKICQSTEPPKKYSNFPGSRGIDWEKEVQTGKTRYLPVKQALGLPSRVNRYAYPLKIAASSRVVTTKSMETVTRGNFSKPGAQVSNSVPEKSSLQWFLGSAGHTNPQNLKNAKITEHSKKPVQSSKGSGGSTILERRNPGAANESPMMNPPMTHPYDPALVPPLKNSVLGYCEDAPEGWRIGKGIISSSRRLKNEYSKGSKLHASAKISQSTVQPKKRVRLLDGDSTGSSRVASTKSMVTLTRGNIIIPGSAFIIPELRSPDAVNASGMMNALMTHPCDPALAHFWRGNFDIIGAPEFAPGMLHNCIQAYPPSRVRRKVYEFSKLLPDTLKFELVPRGAIWTSLFNNHCPGKEDIGLYFLASEKERSEIYIALVEFMHNKDLVMRIRINDVELLVLASTALCGDSQRLNREHFLWGLFHRMRQDT